MGEYTARFDLVAVDDAARYVLRLGSTSRGLGSVRINGGAARGFDTSSAEVDVTGMVRTGSNEVVVRVASSLNNRFLARGYYDALPDVSAQMVAIPHRLGRPTCTTTG